MLLGPCEASVTHGLIGPNSGHVSVGTGWNWFMWGSRRQALVTWSVVWVSVSETAQVGRYQVHIWCLTHSMEVVVLYWLTSAKPGRLIVYAKLVIPSTLWNLGTLWYGNHGCCVLLLFLSVLKQTIYCSIFINSVY